MRSCIKVILLKVFLNFPSALINCRLILFVCSSLIVCKFHKNQVTVQNVAGSFRSRCIKMGSKKSRDKDNVRREDFRAVSHPGKNWNF